MSKENQNTTYKFLVGTVIILAVSAILRISIPNQTWISVFVLSVLFLFLIVIYLIDPDENEKGEYDEYNKRYQEGIERRIKMEVYPTSHSRTHHLETEKETDDNPTDIKIMKGSLIKSYHAGYNEIGNFPDLEIIEGDLDIRCCAGFNHLGNFPKLKSIKGNFYIECKAGLNTLEDFPNLETVEGDFNIIFHAGMNTLGSFPVLKSIKGKSSVERNEMFPVLEIKSTKFKGKNINLN